jgi:hypothetical protein
VRRKAKVLLAAALLALTAFFLSPLGSVADLGDWILEGKVWQKATFGKDADGNLYLSGTYGAFLFDDNTASWVHREDFNWDSVIVDTDMVYEWERSANTYWLNILTDQGAFVAKTFREESRIAFELRTEPDTILYMSDSLTWHPQMALRVHSFDGRRVWFSLFVSNAMCEGDDVGRLSGFFDVEHKTFGYVPLETLGLDKYPNVTCMIHDGDHLWVGTGITSSYGIRPDAGLFRVDSELASSTVYNVENGSLPSNGVIDVIVDSGVVWISTMEGLSAYKREQDIWDHFQIDHGTASKEANIKGTPWAEWVFGKISEGDRVEPVGLVFSGYPGNYHYIITLNQEVTGWTDWVIDGSTLPEHLYSCPNDTCPRAGPLWGMWYPVDTLNVSNGWYPVCVKKGVVPRDALVFSLSRTIK